MGALQKCLTFGRASRSAGKCEIRQGILIHGFRIILCWFLYRTDKIIERPVPFHLPFENKNPARFRESSFPGDDPSVLEIPGTREDLLDLGNFDEVLQFVRSR